MVYVTGKVHRRQKYKTSQYFMGYREPVTLWYTTTSVEFYNFTTYTPNLLRVQST